jgi:putative transposase
MPNQEDKSIQTYDESHAGPRVLPNLLNREFKQGIPYKALLTDITYLFYGTAKKAYLSTIKDASTNEILV